MYDQQDQKDDEQDIGDVHRQTGDAAGTESTGDKGEYEKDNGPTKHERLLQSD
jgi:hypothetical protein